METIGSKIATIRKRKGLSQEKLSDLASINLRTLQRIEKNETQPRGETINCICKALGVDTEDLIDYGKSYNEKFIRNFHLSVLLNIFNPIAGLIVPLILWYGNRQKIMHLNEQGINVINFQIFWTILIYLSLTLWGIYAIMLLPGAFYFLPVIACIYLVNIIYPIYVCFAIRKGKLKLYYYNPIKFIS